MTAELRRVLGVGGATVVGLGAMLGTGVFAAWTPAADLAGGALLVANHAAAIPSDAPVIMHGIETELLR